METNQTINVQPSELMVVSNIRFALKASRVNSLAESIKQFGRVHTNLKVEPLPEPGPKGEKYAVREGHYRLAAVQKLNKEGAGLTLPVTVEEPTEGVERLRYQISENLDRENLSPMDMALAFSQLLETGMSKVEVRQLFLRNGKGKVVVPISNATLNIYLSFLEFPKAIQTKIHEGSLGVADAYKLTTKPKELWQPILDKAEADRVALIEADDKLEEKFLADEQKRIDAEAKAKADQEALVQAEKLVATAKEEGQTRLDAAAEAYKLAQAAKGKEAKDKATEHFKAKEADAKVAEKAISDATAQVEKLRKKVEAQATLAAERKKKLEESRKEAIEAAKKKGGKLDIDKAAAKVTGTGSVALTAAEMRKLIETISLPGSFPKVEKIGKALAKAFAGITTDSQLTSELGWITGERKEKPKHVKE